MPALTRLIVVAAAAVVVVAVSPAAARAHAMDVKASVGPPHPEQVRVEVGYEYGDPTEGASVALIDTTKVEVARGKTDAAGVCLLPRPPAGTYRVAVDDGAGHRESITLKVPQSETEVAAAATERRNRWLMGVAGLAVIGGLTLAAKRMTAKTPKEVTS